MTAEGLRESLVEGAWRQGALLPKELLDQVRWAIPDEKPPENAVAVILSQDCDVLAPSLDSEPLVEVAAGESIEAPNPSLAHAKNPRKLDIGVVIEETKSFARLDMRWRGTLPREALRQHAAIGHLRGSDLRALVAWITRRYERAALPDAFNDRLKAKKAFSKLRDILKRATKGQPLGVFVALGTQAEQELPPSEKYSLELYVVLEGTLAPGDSDWEAFEKDVYEPFLERFSSIEGIDVLQHQLVSEDRVSWRDRRVHLRALDLDDLSLRDESPGSTPYER